MDALQPLVSRAVASCIGALLGYLALRLGVQIDPSITEAASIGIAGFFTSLGYGISHKLLDKKLNPSDAATSQLVAQGKSENRRLTPTSNPAIR